MKPLKSRLIHQLKVTMYQPSDVVVSALANAILYDLDKVLVNAFGDLADMGLTKPVILKVKRAVKKRL